MIRESFKRLESAGLQLRRDKCQIGYDFVEFLEHQISAGGRAPIPEYIQKLQTFPQPRTVTELQRFLWTANYYRCYIKDMSGIAEPLYQLLKRGAR